MVCDILRLSETQSESSSDGHFRTRPAQSLTCSFAERHVLSVRFVRQCKLQIGNLIGRSVT